MDQCVFRKVVDDRIFILLLYVDDILAIVDATEAKRLKSSLEKWFGTIQFEIGNKLLYLGMQVKIMGAGTTIDMSFYVKQMLEGTEVAVKL